MFQGITTDRVFMYEKQEQEKEYLSKMKHTAGDFNRWITRFEDQMETCETIGVELSEEAKVLYFMNNLNDSIFGLSNRFQIDFPFLGSLILRVVESLS